MRKSNRKCGEDLNNKNQALYPVTVSAYRELMNEGG